MIFVNTILAVWAIALFAHAVRELIQLSNDLAPITKVQGRLPKAYRGK